VASIVAVHHHFLPTGGRGIACYLGRFASAWLNRNNYDGRSNWTSSETVCSTSVTVKATINGINLGSLTNTDVPGDVNRGIMKWTLPSLPDGLHNALFTITSGGNGIEDSVAMKVAIASAGYERIVTTSCYNNEGSDKSILDISEVTGFPEDDFPVGGGIPLVGAASPVFRQMTADMPHIWMHLDDWCYSSLTNTGNDWGSPASLTDSNDDSSQPVYSISATGTNVIADQGAENGFVNAIQNSDPRRTADWWHQGWYAHFESAIRRPDIQNFIKTTGAALCRQLGDNEFINDGNPSWWTAKYLPQSSSNRIRFTEMSAGVGNPYTTSNIDPSDFSIASNATAQAESNLIWREFRKAWQMYALDFNPPPLTTVANVPWIVRELQASSYPDLNYSANDYVPMSFKLDLGHTLIISPDFMTCQDLRPIEANNSVDNITITNNFISRLNGNTQFNTGGTPRALESPLGTAQDVVFRSAITAAANQNKNIFIASPKEFGSPSNGNQDALPVSAVNWVDDMVNTFIPALPVSVVLAGGDQHWLTAWKTNNFLQVGMSPCGSQGSSSEVGQGGELLDSTFNMTFPTNHVNLRIRPSWVDTDGYEDYNGRRYGYARFVCLQGSIYAEGLDNRGENYLETQLINRGGITATGNPLPLYGTLSMATKTWTQYASGSLSEGGPNNPSWIFGLQRIINEVKQGSQGFPVVLDSNNTVEAFITGVQESYAGTGGYSFSIVFDPVLSNAVGFTESDSTTRPVGDVLPRSASIQFENVVDGTTFTVSDLSSYTKSTGGPRQDSSLVVENATYELENLTSPALLSASAGLKSFIKLSTSTTTNELNPHNAFISQTDVVSNFSSVVSSGDIILIFPGTGLFGTTPAYAGITGAYDSVNNIIPINGTPPTISGTVAAFVFDSDYIWIQASSGQTTASFQELTHTASADLPAKSLPANLQAACSNGLVDVWCPETNFRASCTYTDANTITFGAIKNIGVRAGVQAYGIDVGELVVLIPYVKINLSVDDAIITGSTVTSAIDAATFTASSNFTDFSGGNSLSGVTLTGNGCFVDDTGLVSIPDLTTISITNAVATFSGAANRIGDIPNGTVGRLSFEESGGDNRHFTVDVTVSNVTDA